MIWRICFFILLCGCSFTEKAFHSLAIGASYVKSPIVISTDQINKGIDVEDCEALREVSFRIRKGESRDRAIASLQSKERMDTFSDLMGKDTLVFVCISGGGSRATAMGMHSLALLEKAYNRMRSTQEERYRDMYSLVDGYSTVSGGSIYASALALHYQNNSFLFTKNDFRESFVARLREGKDEISRHLRENFSKKLRQLLQKNDRSEIFWAVLTDEMNSLLRTPLYKQQCFAQRKMKASPSCLAIVNRQLLEAAYPQEIVKVPEELRNKDLSVFFQDLTYDLQQSSAFPPHGPLRSLGATSALAYFISAGGLPFLSTTFTDFTYLDILAAALNVHHGNYFYLSRYEFGELHQYPRFYFNSTCIDTGMPFVFTQSMVHLPEEKDFFQDKPLKHALTLENLYSSPHKFPLNYAALASAAFPVLTPMRVRKYQYEDSRSQNESTSDVLTVADGGIYDNSGMTTVTDLTEYVLPRSRGKKRIVLVYIDAGIENYHYSIAQRTSPKGSSVPLKLQSPLFNPVIEGMAYGTDVMHFINKQRAVQLALENLQKLREDRELFTFRDPQMVENLNNGVVSSPLREQFAQSLQSLSTDLQVKIVEPDRHWSITDTNRQQDYVIKASKNSYCAYIVGKLEELLYFPISTHQLAGFSKDAIAGQDELFRKIQEISTDFVISAEQESLITDAAQVIVTADQKSCGRYWRVGPRQRLFSLTPEQASQIRTGNVEQIREIFANKGYSLSKQTTVQEMQAEQKWKIEDFFAEGEYIIFNDDGNWHVYSPMQKIYHLDIALTYALMRSQLQDWNGFLQE